MPNVYVSRCPIGGCKKGVHAQLKRTFSMDAARNSCFTHLRWSPDHQLLQDEAQSAANEVDVEMWTEDEAEILEEQGVPPPPRRESRKRKRSEAPRRRSVSRAGRGGGTVGLNASGRASRGDTLTLVPSGSFAPTIMAPDSADDQVVSIRRSSLKCIHDCILRGAAASRAAQAMSSRAAAAFEAEARNMDTIAVALQNALENF